MNSILLDLVTDTTLPSQDSIVAALATSTAAGTPWLTGVE
mgnify:CR=1 FL=1